MKVSTDLSGERKRIMKKTVNLNDFAGSTAQKLKKAADFLRENPGSVLTVPEGTYVLTSALARKNRDDAISGAMGKDTSTVSAYMFSPDYRYTVGWDLSGITDAEIRADGAVFMVDGFMEPISLTGSRRVTLRGFTLDHTRKPYSKGIITKIDREEHEYFTVQFGKEYPLPKTISFPHRHAIYDDEASRFIDFGKYNIYSCTVLENNCVRFLADNLKDSYIGKEFYIWHTFHSRPGILLQDCEDITVKNVTIHSQPGMGIVAHRSKDLYFEGLHVIPSAGEHMSTNTDATHISACRGKVVYDHCFFEGQGDDSLNVQSYYHKIENPKGSRCTLRFGFAEGTHSQMLDRPDVGDKLELTDRRTLTVVDTYRVRETTPHFKALTCDVVLDKPLPADTENLLFMDATQSPALTVKHCVLHNHIARGMLIKCKKALIEENFIYDLDGAAIEVASEAYWYEGLCSTEDIVIRRNYIANCGHRIKFRGTGGIAVGIDCEDPSHKTHRSVVIEDNVIKSPFTDHALYVANVKKITCRRNELFSLAEPAVIME